MPMRFTKSKSGTKENKRPAKRDLGAYQQTRQLRREAAPGPPDGPAGPQEPHEVREAKTIRSVQAEKEKISPPRGEKRCASPGGFVSCW